MKTIILTSIILSIISLALEDSLYDNALHGFGKKSTSKMFKQFGVSFAMLAVGLGVHYFGIKYGIRLGFTYFVWWYLFYDITYNLTSKRDYGRLPWNYYGTTSGWYSKFREQTQGLYPLYLVMSLIAAITLIYSNNLR